ncbi:unnamed protein product [Orchesella dallaii]|uniref:DNA-directed RNA polymerase subunit n=1 Tax=Orchesella dallaii TaxID=48710 RepID=A0ABP1QKT2_9HEXA
MVKEQFRENRNCYRVASVRFSVGSAEDTARQGHLRVVAKHLYQQDGLRTPVSHGVLDRRMGTCGKDSKCATCGKGLQDCVGHFGYLDLELPVFHCGYFGMTLNILQCICKECGSLLLKPEDKEHWRVKSSNASLPYLAKKAMRKKIITLAKKMHICAYCGAPNGVVKKCGMLKIAHDKYRYAKNGEEVKNLGQEFEKATVGKFSQLDPTIDVLTPLVVKSLFERISMSDASLLLMGSDSGSGAPADLILTRIPVPPICIRPSVVSELKAGTTEDDITMKLSEICFLNEVLTKHRESGAKVEMIAEDWDFIQMQCALVINSEMSGLPAQHMGKKKTGRGFVQRLKGKQGRFRGNLSGKRVDFSGRSVISPDPNLRIQQVGVPVHMARILTYPERVTPHNIEWLRKRVRNGPDVHPGANFIESKDKSFRKFLKYGDRDRIAAELKYGDIVERHACDEDIVLFNRQPSLHRLSIMCHKAKIVQGRTLRFNECVCAPYNADFDGDEMNLHLPQTEEAKAEALTLMANEVNLVTPRNGELIISATQDFLTGAYLLTNKNVFFSKLEAARIICWAAADKFEYVELPPPCIFKPMQLWSGKQLISVIFRPNSNSKIMLNMRAKGKNHSGSKEEMDVNDTFVVVHNSELMAGALDKATLGSGAKANVFYVLLKDWGKDAACLAMYRLSRITSNYLMNRGFSIGIGDVTPGTRLIEAKKQLVMSGYNKCFEMLSKPSETLESSEGAVLKALSDIRDSAGKLCVQELYKTNTPLIMAQSGSKGSYINISQMIACVGQQALNGKRVSEGFFMRSLPHFRRNDRGPEAKGFVANSFFSGLTPTEFFFHAMGGREGLVDTAVKTAETGYMQRRLVKALEDLCCNYDMSVRNAEGHVIQLCYGMDGLDPMLMEGKDKPVDFDRAYLNVRAKYPSRSEPYLSSAEKDTHYSTIAVELKYATDERLCCQEFEADMKDYVSKNVFRSQQLVSFLRDCWEKYFRSRMEPATAVGALAAQSIGEPGTQMTLKTFHFAGVASMNITLGVPRIKEIINAAKNISTPIIEARLVAEDPELGVRVKNQLQKTTLKEVCDRIEEILLPNDFFLLVHLSRKKLEKKHLTPDQVSQALMKNLKFKQHDAIRVIDNLLCIFPMDTAKSSSYFVAQNLLRILPKTQVSGTPGINRAIVSSNADNTYKILAEGENFRGVLTSRGVAFAKSTTNNIAQIQNVLGIEAARSSIIREIQYTMESHGMSVDKRHLTLVADLMTCRGEVLGITRHGLAKMKESVLMLASFEKTADHLFEAAYHGQKDVIAGVSESIIMGLPAALGTGCMEIMEKPTPSKVLVERPMIFESVCRRLER